MQDRKKNPFDPIAYPTRYLRRSDDCADVNLQGLERIVKKPANTIKPEDMRVF
jgi:hypothetical protein